jgi:hypothetical protein
MYFILPVLYTVSDHPSTFQASSRVVFLVCKSLVIQQMSTRTLINELLYLRIGPHMLHCMQIA